MPQVFKNIALLHDRLELFPPDLCLDRHLALVRILHHFRYRPQLNHAGLYRLLDETVTDVRL